MFLRSALLVVAASAVTSSCLARGAEDEVGSWSHRVDTADWSMSVAEGANAALVTTWETLGGEEGQTAAVVLLKPDGSRRQDQVASLPKVAASPSGEFFAVADRALAERPAVIHIIDSSTGDSRGEVAGLLDDVQWPNLLWSSDSELIWTEFPLDEESDPLTTNIVRSDVTTGESRLLGVFDDVGWMELSDDRTRLAAAVAPRGSGNHDLWIFDLRTGAKLQVTRGIDVQYVRWRDHESGYLEAKDEPVRRPAGSGPSDADEFFLARDVSPGKLYSWSIVARPEALQLDFKGQVPGRFSISPDKRSLAVTGWRKQDERGLASLWLVDPQRRATREVVPRRSHPSVGEVTLFSGSGKYVAVAVDDRLEVVDVDSSLRQPINSKGTVALFDFEEQAAWSADGSLLFFSNMGPDDRTRPSRHALWRWRPDGSLTPVLARPNQP